MLSLLPPVIIPKWSFDPWAYKKAAFTSYFKRSFTHFSNEALHKMELEHIYDCGLRHGYSRRFMWNVYMKEKAKFETSASLTDHHELATSNEVTQDSSDRFPIPFRLHNYRTIRQALKSNNMSCTFKRATTVFSLLCNDKDRRAEGFKSGVYKIPLHNVDDNRSEVYVGATARNFKDRLNKHKDSITKGNLVTVLAQRAFEKDVNINW